jgi:stage IV sporulation protein FB
MPLGYGREAAVSLAGPLINGIGCFLFWVWGQPRTALIHGVLAAFHLLPVSAMDGGEAVYALLCCWWSEKRSRQAVLSLSVIVLLPLCSLGFFLLFQTGYNASLLILTVYLILLLIFKEKH